MRVAILMLGLSSMLTATVAQPQVWVGTTTRDASSPQSSTIYNDTSSSSTSNTNAMELVELTGMRKRFVADRTKGMMEAKQELLHEYPFLTPAFVNEWAKRVAAQMNPDDYMAIVAAVYSAHFTDDELAELVQGQRNENAGAPPSLPQPLKDKLRRMLPTMAGEIAASVTKAGVTLGAEVAEQVAREHPDWIRRSATTPDASR